MSSHNATCTICKICITCQSFTCTASSNPTRACMSLKCTHNGMFIEANTVRRSTDGVVTTVCSRQAIGHGVQQAGNWPRCGYLERCASCSSIAGLLPVFTHTSHSLPNISKITRDWYGGNLSARLNYLIKHQMWNKTHSIGVIKCYI